MTTTPPPGPTALPYRPQAILKPHRPSSLDYRVRHELPVHLFRFGFVGGSERCFLSVSDFFICY